MPGKGCSSPRWAIQVEGVTKRFGNNAALRGVDLRVRQGEFLTIFGPNGAGKTTLLKVLATICKPTSGRVHLAGLELGKQSAQIRHLIGVVPHQTLLYDDLTAYENLRFYARMYQVPHPDERIHAVVAQMGLSARLHDRVRTLSRGMQQRLSIARAVLHNPPIMLLDEPETGLDQEATALLAELLGAAGGGKTVVMTTHRLERGLEMAQRVAIMVGGKIAYEESKQALDREGFVTVYSQYTGAPR